MERHLHIVSFNVPYPPDYGGVIDIFYKIKSLHDEGVNVHLHTYHYGREQSPDLEKICASVQYYPRQKFYQAIYSSVPYIVGSRKSDDLLPNLVQDDYPILFEGLHTCFYLNHPSLKERFKIVRMHNIEWDYYHSLGKSELNFFRKFYLYTESRKLKQFEDVLEHANLILAISPNDKEYLEKKFSTVHYSPAFHPFSKVNSKPGKGDYAIYHGNLSVAENNQAAFFLIHKVFQDISFPFKISGKEPLATLIKESKKPNARFDLIPNPYDEAMQHMITNAQINVLPTFQATGVKLKLLNALFNGRFCVVNSEMVSNTGLESLCVVANHADEMKKAILDLINLEFTETEIANREKILSENFSNQANVNELIKRIPSFKSEQSLSLTSQLEDVSNKSIEA